MSKINKRLISYKCKTCSLEFDLLFQFNSHICEIHKPVKKDVVDKRIKEISELKEDVKKYKSRIDELEKQLEKSIRMFDEKFNLLITKSDAKDKIIEKDSVSRSSSVSDLGSSLSDPSLNKNSSPVKGGMNEIMDICLQINKGILTNEYDEDNYYLLGNVIADFLGEIYTGKSDLYCSFVSIVLPKIMNIISTIENKITERAKFFDGLYDSDYSMYSGYVMLRLGIFDSKYSIDTQPCKIVSSIYPPEYAIQPMEKYVKDVILVKYTYTTNLEKNTYKKLGADEQLDYMLLDLTEELSTEILNSCIDLYRKLYHDTYGSYKYQPNQTIFLQKILTTIELASTKFEIGHMCREMLYPTPEIITGTSKNEMFSLISTRIHKEEPPYDIVHFAEYLFDEGDYHEYLAKFMKKYISTLKTYKHKYIEHARYK